MMGSSGGSRIFQIGGGVFYCIDLFLLKNCMKTKELF